MSPSLKRRRTHSPSVRGRVVKGLAAGGVGFAELADEVDDLDLAQVDGDYVAGGVEQFELAFVDKIRGGDVAVHRVAVEFSDYDFLMGRGHSVVGQTRPGCGFLGDGVSHILTLLLRTQSVIWFVVAKSLTL